MIEHIQATGDTGRLKIVDRTDEASKLVEFWVQSLSPIAVPQLPWAYSLDTNRSNWFSYAMPFSTLWQKLTVQYAGTHTNKATLHLGDTGTGQLEGPTDFEVDLYGYIEPPAPPQEGEPPPEPAPAQPRLVSVKVGGVYKKAIPYVRYNGIWEQAIPLVRTADGWKELA